MNAVLIARLEDEIACACDQAGVVVADHHAWNCYRRQLIDAPTFGHLHALAKAQADLLLKERQ